MEFNDKTVYILDSYGLIFRCYFAFINRPLTNPRGENVSALFGFFRNLHYILQHYKFAHQRPLQHGRLVDLRDEFREQFAPRIRHAFEFVKDLTPVVDALTVQPDVGRVGETGVEAFAEVLALEHEGQLSLVRS